MRCIAGLLGVVAMISAGVVTAAEDNDDLAAAMATLIGVHNAALPPSFVPDPFIGIPAGVVTFGTNLGLKYVKPMLSVPPGWTEWPNSSDQCSYDFRLRQSEFEYSNLFGFINLRPLPQDWGEFSRGGPVETYHANSQALVTVTGPGVVPGRRPHPDEPDLPGNQQLVRIPAGNHSYYWRAGTQLSQAFDVIIPLAILGFNAGYYGASWADIGADATRQAARLSAARQIFQDLVIEAGIIAADDAGLFGGQTTVTHEREQAITVYDVRSPVLTASQLQFEFEATDFGGVIWDRVADQIADTITAFDHCGRPHTLSNDHPRLLGIGSNQLTWTVRDLGPAPGGGVNSETLVQTINVVDTQAPILVPPPSLVIEVPAEDNGIATSEVAVGVPRVVDLADPTPSVSNTLPPFFPKDSRTPVQWTATDASGNASEGSQLITVKTEGENTAPYVADRAVSTLTSQPVDIVLTGNDDDVLGGIPDPLSFRLRTRPENGDFIAPLFPFFIEDYRTNPAGPYGEAFRLSGNRGNWLYDNVCNDPDLAGLPSRDRIRLDWVYRPQFLHVTDDGTYYMIDYGWYCQPSNATSYQRISKWDSEGNYISERDYNGTNEAFVMDRDGFLYELSRTGAGSSTTLTLTQVRTNFEDLSYGDQSADAWRFDFASTRNPALGLDDPVSNSQFSYARVDSERGLVFVTDRRRVFVYDVRDDLADGVDEFKNGMGEQYRGALKSGDQFLCVNGNWGNSWTGFAIEVDSEGYLFVTDSCQNRVHKFTPSYFDEAGELVLGDYVGWLGRCETSSNNACNEETQTSKGYSCTDETCTVATTAGSEAGQFTGLPYIALDPKDVLYVADNPPGGGGRVQRFASDGTFGGEARSTGTGINQGDRPGFVLGNMGTVKAVSVNSAQFFVVDQEESFVNVFETTPLKDITGSSATVTYVSAFDFHSDVDSFSYVASDGLDESEPATVFVNVSRNFRPPEAIPQSISTLEDEAVEVTLTGNDPDGVLGEDFNGLDTLTFRVVDQPEHGTVTGGSGAVRSYTPAEDYFGADSFTFVANDGRDDSLPQTVSIEITPVDDPPKNVAFEMPPRIGQGFPATLKGSYTDDGPALTPYVFINWGDGNFDYPGDFVETDDGAELQGVKLIEPPLGDGAGQAVAEHLFTQAGNYNVLLCLIDDQGRDVCAEDQVRVDTLANVTLDLSTQELDIPAGTSGVLELDIVNQAMRGVTDPGAPPAGLTASDVRLQAVFTSVQLELDGLSGGSACTVTAAGFECALGAMAPADMQNLILQLRGSPEQIYDEMAMVQLRLTTGTPAVNETVDRYVAVSLAADSTDSDGDGMTDVFENRYGLNPADPGDAGDDADGDGLSNLAEYEARTNPELRDTDGDGIDDGFELANDLDPLDGADCPNWLCGGGRAWRGVLRSL